ncbi:MAG: DUF4844 domain-containing protein [Rhodoferax sp.]
MQVSRRVSLCTIAVCVFGVFPMQGEAAVGRQRMLDAFVAKKKFLPEQGYPGAINEAERARLQALIDALATRLQQLVNESNPKPVLLAAFEAAYSDFAYLDTEDRQRCLGYFEELMDIFGVQSSDGLLNRLMYGFDPQQSLDANNRVALQAMSSSQRELLERLRGMEPDAAVSALEAELGPPAVTKGSDRIWMLDAPAQTYLSVVRSAGVARLVWVVRGQFTYMHDLR